MNLKVTLRFMVVWNDFLQTTIEDCVIIGNHIISRAGFRKPEGYRDTFTVLGENKIIPEDFVLTMREMVGFRNLLVHLYWEIKLDRVYQILQNNLNDIEKFIGYISQYLQNRKKEAE